VSGLHFYVKYLLMERFTLIGEYVGATGEYDTGDLAG